MWPLNNWPRGMDGVANSDHVARPTNIQVRSSKCDETRIGYSM